MGYYWYESGYNACPTKPEWATDIQEQCEINTIPFSSNNGKNKKVAKRLLEGKTYSEMPTIVEVKKGTQ